MALPVRAVLFDLDGTLLDSAPDLCHAVNRVARGLGEPAVPLARLREVVSKGGRAMLAVALPALSEAEREALLPAFLAHYGEALAVDSVVFPGVGELLATLEARGIRWGIVTNKPEGLARGVVAAYGWSERCGVLVGGDTLAQRKPHPEPLRYACRAMSLQPEEVIYVGDDLRDIESARAAGIVSVAALWGYREAGDDPGTWGADHCLEAALDVLSLPALARA